MRAGCRSVFQRGDHGWQEHLGLLAQQFDVAIRRLARARVDGKRRDPALNGRAQKQFRDPDQLQALDSQIDSALGEQVADLMDKAEREATGTRNGPLKSLLYQRIRVYLERWSKVPA